MCFSKLKRGANPGNKGEPALEYIICVPTRVQPQCTRNMVVIKKKYGSDCFHLRHMFLHGKELSRVSNIWLKQRKGSNL